MSRTPALTTPRGRAIYPHLNTPDTKFKTEGEYHVRLAVKTVLAEPLIKLIDEAHARAIATAKKENPKLKTVKEANLPYKLSEENDEETVFNIKMKASYKDKKSGDVVSMRPALFDGKGKPLAKDVKVGGGSTLRVSFDPFEFYTAGIGAGVALRMKAVQVIELKSFGGSADAFGFEAEEGGFDGENVAEQTNQEAGEEKQESTGGTGEDF